jgi:hypothetical protein
MSEYTFHGWHDSPGIAQALRDGREPSDIAVVVCDRCGSAAYYNQGSHCACEHCDRCLNHLLDSDTGDVTTLDDLWSADAESIDIP